MNLGKTIVMYYYASLWNQAACQVNTQVWRQALNIRATIIASEILSQSLENPK